MFEFTEEAIREIARVAALANRTIENIGARRLHTCIERIIDEISFDACDYPPGDLVTIDEEYVRSKDDDMLVASDGGGRRPLGFRLGRVSFLVFTDVLPTASASSGRRPSGRRCRPAGRCPS